MVKTRKQRAGRAILERAVTWAGSKPALAAELRVSETTIREWIVMGRAPGPAARLLAKLLVGEDGFSDDERELERALRA